ncbi:DUF5984 family protein [Nocardia sp. NPDC056000]|uniref:DUF5984 family protein n=1 Tax=Nocardia sp. NPDC056000 TaxID=3345674 RepID=UPI0035DC4416
MRFRFELTPLEEVHPWGSVTPNLHWFGLTDGLYCLDVGGVELLRYTDRTMDWLTTQRDRPPLPWVDYYVVRLWEDMLAVLPYILEPVPDDLVDYMITGSMVPVDLDDSILDNPAVDAAWDASGERRVDTSYLRFGPTLSWCRTLDPVDTVTVGWHTTADPDGEIAFTAPLSGRVSVPTTEFIDAVTDFDRRLFESMRVRVDRLAETGPPDGIELDIPHLIREHEDRRTWLARALARQVGTDWEAVRAGVAILVQPGVGQK